VNEFEEASSKKPAKEESFITLFLAGDVMTGRGIDQILPYPNDPTIHESYLKNARRYVELGEEANGPIAGPVDFPYIWGDTLAKMERAAPDVRIINLETSTTGSDDFWEDKEIHYRMNPKNIACLTAAKIDFCSLANNHILDWGYSGLTETLETLRKAKVKFAGAGATWRRRGPRGDGGLWEGQGHRLFLWGRVQRNPSGVGGFGKQARSKLASGFIV